MPHSFLREGSDVWPMTANALARLQLFFAQEDRYKLVYFQGHESADQMARYQHHLVRYASAKTWSPWVGPVSEAYASAFRELLNAWVDGKRVQTPDVSRVDWKIEFEVDGRVGLYLRTPYSTSDWPYGYRGRWRTVPTIYESEENS